MINIKKGDLLILDFDDTIWIWKRNTTYNRPDFLKMRMDGETSYKPEYGSINRVIRNCISYAKSIGAQVIILSAISNTFEYLDKCDIMKREFGVENSCVVGVSSSEDKPIMVSYLMNLYNTSRDNTYFVDDNKDILYKCKNVTGVNIYTPLELL